MADDDIIAELLKRYAPPEAQAPSPLAELLAQSYGTEDMNARMPATGGNFGQMRQHFRDNPKAVQADQEAGYRRVGPMGSAAMAERRPWMRDYLPESLANFLAAALIAPMAVRPTGMMPPRAMPRGSSDLGITGGAPTPAAVLRDLPADLQQAPARTDSSVGLAVRDGIRANRLDLPTLRDQTAWEVASGNNSKGRALQDLNMALDALGIEQPQRAPANINKPLRPGQDPYQIPDDPYTMAAIEQSFRRAGKDAPPPALSISELLNRPGVRTAEGIGDSFDPVFIGARTGNFYRGPDTPANDHPPGGPYDPSYNRSLQKQRQPAEDAWIEALLHGKVRPGDPGDPFLPPGGKKD